MKKIYIASIFILFVIFAIADIMEENGKAGKTGSPGENDCTGCHTSFTVNSGPGSITVSSPNLTNWEYVLGNTYQIDVTVAHPGVPLFGFGFEALRASNNTNGGTFQITSAITTQLKTANVNGSNRTNVVHKQNGGLTTNAHTFSFNWIAPATNIGNIRFYAAGNATDNQGDSLGDYIYTVSQLVVPFTTGISEAGSHGFVNVFPNPAHDYVSVSIGERSASLKVELFDCKGNLILKEIKQSSIGTASVRIELPEEIKNGIYFLKATTEKKINSTKILVLN